MSGLRRPGGRGHPPPPSRISEPAPVEPVSRHFGAQKVSRRVTLRLNRECLYRRIGLLQKGEILNDVVGTIAGVGGAGAAVTYGVTLLNKVVGPSAKTLGVVLSEWSDYRLRNFLRIAEVADAIAPDDTGEVHPRVAQRIVEEASWLDDDVMRQYVGGLLAASRTPSGKEERGAYYVNLLGGMTAMQVKLHHAIYSALRETGTPARLATEMGSPATRVWLPGVATFAALEIGRDDGGGALSEAVIALHRDGLISRDWELGSMEGWTAKLGYPVSQPLLYVAPTHSGVLLYLWSHGIRSSLMDDLFLASIRELDPPGPRIVGAQVGEKWIDQLAE